MSNSGKNEEDKSILELDFNDENNDVFLRKDAQTVNSTVDLEAIETLLFPHAEIRNAQDALIKKIDEVINNKHNLVVHAPTGLGKTAAALSPALTHILKNKNKSTTIYFLTSRHTQHKIVIDTLNKINKKFNLNIVGSSIIGKKHLCLQPGVEKYPSKDFAEFCKVLVEGGKCNFYTRVKGKDKITVDAEAAIGVIKQRHGGVAYTEDVIAESTARELCPYEIAMLLAKQAKVIVTDYHYLFNGSIRDNFFKKINKELKDAIIIVDEAHNLPARVKDLASEYLSNITISRAIAEARKYSHSHIIDILKQINTILEQYASSLASEVAHKYQRNSYEEQKKNTVAKVTLNTFEDARSMTEKKFTDIMSSERYVSKSEFIAHIETIKGYDDLVAELVFVAQAVREQQHLSYIGSVANFLEQWLKPDEGFTRIVSVKRLKDNSDMITLSYRCLDPSIITASVINDAYATVLMSGTLTPTSMYRELLGIDAEELTLKSPFPAENRLNIIVPKTSTKYESRSLEQYRDIGTVLVDICQQVPGCIAIYFPSYYLMNEVAKHLVTKTTKTVFSEQPEMSKAEKQEFLEKFSSYKEKGAVLLAVVTGSFAEGIDMPGILKGVIIVGLPLQKPDLETKALIEYYDTKFSKGWDYGYLFPAFTKTIQAAGRCIRNERDKGIIVFLDERYSWNNYYRCFPPTWQMRTTLLYKEMIRNFFNRT